MRALLFHILLLLISVNIFRRQFFLVVPLIAVLSGSRDILPRVEVPFNNFVIFLQFSLSLLLTLRFSIPRLILLLFNQNPRPFLTSFSLVHFLLFRFQTLPHLSNFPCQLCDSVTRKSFLHQRIYIHPIQEKSTHCLFGWFRFKSLSSWH